MKIRKERDYEAPIGTWTLIFSFLGFCALVSAGITALAINFNL